MARFQISIRGALLLMAAIATLLATAIELNRRLNNFVLSPYRVQSAAELLIEYMDETDRWPRNWDEISQLVESKGTNLRGIEWFHDVRRNVTIDFSFDPHSVTPEYGRLKDEPPLRVIVAHDGTIHGATGDPNTMILQYLQKKYAPSNKCEQSDGHQVADRPR